MKSILAVFFLSILLFSACDEPDQRSGEFDVYTGTQGIRMEVQPGQPPYEVYYYDPAFIQGQGNDENSFIISVELDNEGASWATGGLYVSGFSPTYLRVEKMLPPPGSRATCFWANARNINGEWIFDLGCQGVGSGYYVSDDDWFASANLGSLSRLIPGLRDSDNGFVNLLDGIILGGGESGGTQQFSIDFSIFQTNTFNRGKMLNILLKNPQINLDFDRFGIGHEYQLAGDTYEYPGGETDIATLQADILNFPIGTDYIDQDLLFTNCYAYSTYSTPTVCVDPAPFEDAQKVCRQEEVQQRSTNGAPVSLTISNVLNTPRSTTFTINVRNVGGGDVFSIGSAEVCSPYSTKKVVPTDKDVVLLPIIRIGPQEMDCNTRVVRLDPSGEGRVTCTYWHNLQYTSKSGFQTPVNIEAWYAYREETQRTVRIRKIG